MDFIDEIKHNGKGSANRFSMREPGTLQEEMGASGSFTLAKTLLDIATPGLVPLSYLQQPRQEPSKVNEGPLKVHKRSTDQAWQKGSLDLEQNLR